MLSFIEDWLKKAALEVQEYVRLSAAAFRGMVTPPFYRHDIVEQFDAIGVASLTVVLLTGFFTGAVLALQSGLTLDQFGARPVVGRLVSASMIKELGPVLTGLMLTGPRRLGHRGRARLDGRHRPDQRAARPRHRPDPQAGRAAGAGRHLHGAGADRHRRLRRHRRRLDRRALPAAGGERPLLVVDLTRRSTCRTSGWGSSSRSSSGFVIVTIACHVGLRTTGGTQGVGKATTVAVVAGSVAVIAVDFFVTRVLISLMYY